MKTYKNVDLAASSIMMTKVKKVSATQQKD